MGIANRDIKLENTLLMDLSERPLLKLCDFGYSKDEYQGSACKTLCGKHEAVTPTDYCHNWHICSLLAVATLVICYFEKHCGLSCFEFWCASWLLISLQGQRSCHLHTCACLSSAPPQAVYLRTCWPACRHSRVCCARSSCT